MLRLNHSKLRRVNWCRYPSVCTFFGLSEQGLAGWQATVESETSQCQIKLACWSNMPSFLWLGYLAIRWKSYSWLPWGQKRERVTPISVSTPKVSSEKLETSPKSRTAKSLHRQQCNAGETRWRSPTLAHGRYTMTNAQTPRSHSKEIPKRQVESREIDDKRSRIVGECDLTDDSWVRSCRWFTYTSDFISIPSICVFRGRKLNWSLTDHSLAIVSKNGPCHCVCLTMPLV